jgi:hypothetical protein
MNKLDKNIYKDLYTIIPHTGVHKYEIMGIYITPTDIWCTDTFRAITIQHEHPHITAPVFIPHEIVKAMAGNADIITITPHVVQVGALTLQIPQEMQSNNIQWYTTARKHTDSMVLTESTGVFPDAMNAELLASTLDYITAHEKTSTVHIYHSDIPHTPITIKSERITAIHMAINK